MESFQVTSAGPHVNPLNGTVYVGGAKNSALKLMAAALLAPGTSTIRNVPDILDVTVMAELRFWLTSRPAASSRLPLVTVMAPWTSMSRPQHTETLPSVAVIAPLMWTSRSACRLSVVGTPLTKVYVLAEHPDPKQQHYLSLYKMGEGPLYSFFVPYHLVHFEVPNAIARVVLFRDAVTKPLGGPVLEVCAVAKRELKAGEVLDDYGMYMTYGEAVNVQEMSEKLSKDLKARGFKFVGPVIVYAFAQAVGMVNDHIVSCHRYLEVGKPVKTPHQPRPR